MKASFNRPVSAPVPETAPHVGARFIAPWAADNPPSSPIAASFAARKPRAAAHLVDPFADPATQKIWAEEHALAFTVAGMARDDILAALRDGITDVIAGKLSREEWLEGARARLIKAGYWREEGEKGGITPSRLQLIFDTNTANAYHGGRWQRLEERRETHPYLMYLTKRDHRVRPEHRAWEGLILPIDHPFWQTHFPPNGFRCRCAVLGVTQAEYDQLKRDGGQFAGGTVKFDNDIDADLEALDPGFAYNPGIPGSRAAALQRLAEEKAARQTAKAAETAAPSTEHLPTPAPQPKASPTPTSSDPEWLNAGLEHLPTTDRTSIEEAVRDTNPEYIKIALAQIKLDTLCAARDAISRRTFAGNIAWNKKDLECQQAERELNRLTRMWGKNCQRCVVAYELRRRGFDVTAAMRLARNDKVADNWDKLFLDYDFVDIGKNISKNNPVDAVRALENELISYGEGSRSVIDVAWQNGGLHVFIAEVRGGKVVYVDPQTGIMEPDWKERFKPKSLRCARVDNRQVNLHYLNQTVQPAKRSK